MDILDDAINFAVQAHSGIVRKASGMPYILHPLEVTAIAGTMTYDREVLAAAVLHDTVEDAGISIEEIRERFGERVAFLVAAETEDKMREMSPSESWRMRKESSLRMLEEENDVYAMIICLGDKLSNLRTISGDYDQIGDQLWQRFKAPNGKEDMAWYYRTLAKSLCELAGTPPYEEYLQLLDKIFPVDGTSGR